MSPVFPFKDHDFRCFQRALPHLVNQAVDMVEEMVKEMDEHV
ncbi:conserved hypothetical protein [delta proteobacterium NaphS2]|nr:conserved hypothetical protein [delta proteobacterium NaphS2]